jgi:hypothetical protein
VGYHESDTTRKDREMTFTFAHRVFKNEDVVIDTCLVNDGFKPYETMVIHHLYHDGRSIIVEAYDTQKEAFEGHKKWKELLTTDPLPESLVNVGNDPINLLSELLGADRVFPLQRR